MTFKLKIIGAIEGDISLQSVADSLRKSGVLEIRDRLQSVSGGRVLDVGTQHGDFIGTLMKSMKDYKEFVGIDILEKNLEKARANYVDDPTTFELMNAEELSFDDESFDTVCISFSIHHLENVKAVLGEMFRVLKPGGYLIVQEMFSDRDQSEAKITEMLTHHLGARVDRMEDTPHFDTYSRQELKDFVDKLALSNNEVYQTTWGLKCLYCDNFLKCEDPRSEHNMELGREEIEDVLQRAKEHSDTEIQYEAELLLERVETTGYHSASQLFFICER